MSDILKLILPLFKELMMKYSIWKISVAVSIPILCWVSADLLKVILEFIQFFFH